MSIQEDPSLHKAAYFGETESISMKKNRQKMSLMSASPRRSRVVLVLLASPSEKMNPRLTTCYS